MILLLFSFSSTAINPLKGRFFGVETHQATPSRDLWKAKLHHHQKGGRPWGFPKIHQILAKSWANVLILGRTFWTFWLNLCLGSFTNRRTLLAMLLYNPANSSYAAGVAKITTHTRFARRVLAILQSLAFQKKGIPKCSLMVKGGLVGCRWVYLKQCWIMTPYSHLQSILRTVCLFGQGETPFVLCFSTSSNIGPRLPPDISVFKAVQVASLGSRFRILWVIIFRNSS